MLPPELAAPTSTIYGAFDANQMPLLRQIVNERYSATGYGVLNFISTSAGGIMVYAGGRLMDAKIDLARLFQGAGVALFIAGLLLLAIKLPKQTSVEVNH